MESEKLEDEGLVHPFTEKAFEKRANMGYVRP
jgi:hypothetical protein